MTQLSSDTLRLLRSRFKKTFTFDTLLQLYGQKYPDILTDEEKLDWDSKSLNQLINLLSRNGKKPTPSEISPVEDERLQAAVTELLSALAARSNFPETLCIGGVPLLVEEFVMPILNDLLTLSKPRFPQWRINPADGSVVDINSGEYEEPYFEQLVEPELQFHTKRVAVKSDVKQKSGASISDKSLVFLAIQNGDLQIAISSKRDLKSGEGKFHEYKFENGAVVPLNPGEDERPETIGVTGYRNAPSTVDIGSFSYNLYMQESLYGKYYDRSNSLWWQNLPLLSPQHCPTGKRNCSAIAKSMGMKIGHEGMDISTAFRALKEVTCPYAMILPSYLEGIEAQGITMVEIEKLKLDPNLPQAEKIDTGIEELTGHSITILWQNKKIEDYVVEVQPRKHIGDSEKISNRGFNLINKIASYIDQRLNP